MLEYIEYNGHKLGRSILEGVNVDKLREIIREVKTHRNSTLSGVSIVSMNKEACINWLLETPINKTGHKFDHDVTRLIPSSSGETPLKNELLNLLEKRPIPPKKHGDTSQKHLKFKEALEFMEPCQDSLPVSLNDRYYIVRAAKELGYRVTSRVEYSREVDPGTGVRKKIFRFWVVSHSREV